MEMPEDIRARLHSQYSAANLPRATKAVQGVLDSSWNVGSIQLARSIIILSDGDIEKLESDYIKAYGDPRDVIMAAEARLGSPRDWGMKPFDER